MATSFAPPPASVDSGDIRFFARLSLGLVAFILFGFVQWALRGMVDIPAVPLWVHLHGLAMLAWLFTLVVQSRFALAGRFDWHRPLGWAGLAVALAIGPLGCFTGQQAVALGRVPPFFSDDYFLALTHIEALSLSALVVAAVALRRRTAWHRRLMVGATIIIMEPAIGRLIPVPLLGVWADAVTFLIQLVPLWLLARHDRRTLGAVHGATWLLVALVAAERLSIVLIDRSDALLPWAQRLSGG